MGIVDRCINSSNVKQWAPLLIDRCYTCKLLRTASLASIKLLRTASLHEEEHETYRTLERKFKDHSCVKKQYLRRTVLTFTSKAFTHRTGRDL